MLATVVRCGAREASAFAEPTTFLSRAPLVRLQVGLSIAEGWPLLGPSMSSPASAVGVGAACAGQARAGLVARVGLVPSADPVACGARAEEEGAAVGADPGVEVLPAPFYAHCFGSCRLLNNRLPQCTELVTTFSRSPKRRLDES